MPSVEERRAVREALHWLRSPCVVELGAHCGEDEEWIRSCFTEPAHYVMVEPDPRNCQKILDRMIEADDGQATVFSFHRELGTRRLIIGAVADHPAMRTFHFSENLKDHTHTSGSLRPPTGHLHHFPEIRFPETGLVQCYTLDQIFEREWLTKIDLLWVDIQGAENMMIAGGKTALKHTRFLFMEVEKVELYQGEALRDDLVSMLPGWKVVREFEFNVLMANDGFSERGPR